MTGQEYRILAAAARLAAETAYAEAEAARCAKPFDAAAYRVKRHTAYVLQQTYEDIVWRRPVGEAR